MRLTNLERGALYWAKDVIKNTIEEDKEFYNKFDYKDETLRKINESILNKKAEHLNALENLLERI